MAKVLKNVKFLMLTQKYSIVIIPLLSYTDITNKQEGGYFYEEKFVAIMMVAAFALSTAACGEKGPEMGEL